MMIHTRVDFVHLMFFFICNNSDFNQVLRRKLLELLFLLLFASSLPNIFPIFNDHMK